ncbi:MAG: hypothetical protein R3E97_15270 [Candidatus Eisenbacteria bacterium]
MKDWITVLFATLIVPLGFSSAAMAGPNAGGALVLHRNPSLLTADHDYCAESGLSSCEEAVVTAPADPDSTVIVFALAAFPAGASPRLKGLAFGIAYDPERIVLVDHGTCAGFELPDNDWPNTGTGTAIVLGSAATSLLTPFYWFAAYSLGDTASFALEPHPTQGGDFADDSVPPLLDSVAGYGRMGFAVPGGLPCPTTVPGGGEPEGGSDPPAPPEQGEGSPEPGCEFPVRFTIVGDNAIQYFSGDLEIEWTGGDEIVLEMIDGVFTVNGHPHYPHPRIEHRLSESYLEQEYGAVPFVRETLAQMDENEPYPWNAAVRQYGDAMSLATRAAAEGYARTKSLASARQAILSSGLVDSVLVVSSGPVPTLKMWWKGRAGFVPEFLMLSEHMQPRVSAPQPYSGHRACSFAAELKRNLTTPHAPPPTVYVLREGNIAAHHIRPGAR